MPMASSNTILSAQTGGYAPYLAHALARATYATTSGNTTKHSKTPRPSYNCNMPSAGAKHNKLAAATCQAKTATCQVKMKTVPMTHKK